MDTSLEFTTGIYRAVAEGKVAETREAPGQVRGLNILVIDDDPQVRQMISFSLSQVGHKVATAENSKQALAEVNRQVFDLVLVDMMLGNESGLDLIEPIKRSSSWTRVVVITAHESVQSAVEAMRRGAYTYLVKPFSRDEMQCVIERISEVRGLEQSVSMLRRELDHTTPSAELESKSATMRKALAMAKQAATSNATILLRGECGTGKTMLARSIHTWSNRAAKPFGVISCPALPAELLESQLFGHVKGSFTGALRDNPGRIAACDGGTLLLDEIGDLPLGLQPKLLRFVQDREYERIGENRARSADVRLITATNTELETEIAERRFRKDLFFRLKVIEVTLPPLRERREDVPALARKMLKFFSAENHKQINDFSPDALRALVEYDWPGNVRELRNAIERAVVLCAGEKLGAELLPQPVGSNSDKVQVGDPVALEELEQEHIKAVLARSPTLEHAAKILGIDTATLWRKRKKFNV